MSLAKIEGKEIVIRIPIDALPACFIAAMDKEYGGDDHTCQIEDLEIFAGDFVAALNHEDEIGETVLHVALDRALIKALEFGSEGISS